MTANRPMRTRSGDSVERSPPALTAGDRRRDQRHDGDDAVLRTGPLSAS
jgi:hypothetical protein